MGKIIIFLFFISLAFGENLNTTLKGSCQTQILKGVIDLVNGIIKVRNEVSKNLTLTYLLGYYPYIENITFSNLNCSINEGYESFLKISLYEKYKVTSPDIKISKRKHRLFYRISVYKFLDAIADSIFQNYGQYITNLNITLYIYDGKQNKYIPGCILSASYDNYLSGSYNIICKDNVFLFCVKEYKDIEKKNLKQRQNSKEDKNV